MASQRQSNGNGVVLIGGQTESDGIHSFYRMFKDKRKQKKGTYRTASKIASPGVARTARTTPITFVPETC